MSTPFITTQTLGTLRNNFTGTVGHIIQVGPSDLTVDALGRWVVSGNSGTHSVTIYDIAGASVVATASINTSGAGVGAYLYASITPVTLTAGKRYAIESAETNGGDQWYDSDTIVTQDPTAGTVESAVFSHTSANGGYNQSYVPANFKFTVVTQGLIACRFAKDLGNNGGGGTLTSAYTCGSGSNTMLIVAFQGDQTNDDITGVTYNGVAMTLVNKTHSAGDRWVYMYYLLAPASGSHNVVITSTNSHYLLALAADYIGVKQSGQPDNNAINHKDAPGSDTLTTTLTTVADNCFTILVGGGFNSAPLAGTGSLRRTFGVAFNEPGLFDSNAAKTPAGSTSMEWHMGAPGSGHQMASVMGSFAPAQFTTQQTITGVAKISITTTKTIAGVANIAVPVLKTITGIARITVIGVQRTIGGLGRITATTLRTISGVGRVTISTAQIIIGAGRIQATILRAIQGVARLTAVAAQTIVGKARIQVSAFKTISGVAAIVSPNITTIQTITGVAKIVHPEVLPFHLVGPFARNSWTWPGTF